MQHRTRRRPLHMAGLPSQSCVMKWFIRILIVLAVLIAGLLWFGYSKIDDLIKLGIEKAGSEALQVPVKLEKVSLSMFSGAGSLEGLEVGTPAGFSAPRTLRIGKAEIAINTTATKEDRIVIKHIRLNEPDIHLELGSSGTNLAQIARNARSTADSLGSSAPTSQPPAPSEAAPAPSSPSQPQKKDIRLQVDEVLISGARLNASVGLLPGAKAVVTLPEIKLTELGTGPDGITPAELTAVILSKLADESAKAGAGGAVENLLKGGKIKVDTQELKQGVNELKKLFGK